MKKLMIAAAIVCAAAMSQASTVLWTSATEADGVKLSALAGNGTYSAAGDPLGYNYDSMSFVLKIYESGTLIDTVNGSVSFDEMEGTIYTSFKTTASLANQTTYAYDIVMTGKQTDMTGVIGSYNYTDATIESTLSGTFKAKTDTSQLTSSSPSEWTVAGAVAVPEPTSGLLLLLGVAGMALRRRRA